MVERRREEEDRRTALESNLARDKMEGRNQRHMDMTEDVRRERERRERAREQARLELMYEVQRAREMAAQSAREDQAIASELERRKKESLRNDKMVARVVAESVELRELQEKLKAAEVNAARQAQLAESQALRTQARTYERSMDMAMEAQRMEALRLEEERALEERLKKVEARHVLEEQMAEKEEARRALAAEYERERAAVDAIVQRIQEEDDRDAAARRQKQAEMQRFVETYLRQREAEQAKKAEAEAAEERRIAEHEQRVRQREQQLEEERQRKKQQEAVIHAHLTAVRTEEDQKRIQMEELLNQLHYEEMEDKYLRRVEELRLKKERMKLELQQAHEMARRAKAEQREREQREEEEFRARLMDKFAEDDRLEQLNAQKRRLKMEEHKREVQRLWDEKKAMYEKQHQRELDEERRIADEERAKEEIIEAERQRLLREYAFKLAGFLPKGVLKNQDDLENLRNYVAGEVEKEKSGGFSMGSGSRRF
eukprot:jgi/Mesvir1/13032/Mv06025-RA.1